MFRENDQGVFLRIKVIPNASKDALVSLSPEEIKIRLQAVPEKGKANDRLILFLSFLLDIRKSNIFLISGETSRIKKIFIKNTTYKEVSKRLNNK